MRAFTCAKAIIHFPNKASDRKGSRRAPKVQYGYEDTTVIIADPNVGGERRFPTGLVIASFVDAPGRNTSLIARSLLSDVKARNHPAGFLATDPVYLPGAVAEDLQIPIAEMGYEPVFRYGLDDAGPKVADGDDHRGMLFLEGCHFCPAMPNSLQDVVIDHLRGEISDSEYADGIEDRDTYVMRRQDHQSRDGNDRDTCAPRKVPTRK